MPSRLAVYVRVSTSDQTTAPQLDALRTYAEARGLEVAGVYEDAGVSGARASRPALDRMMADARRRRLDAVAVVKLDRLGRSLHHLLELTGELEALGVDLVSLDDGLDTSTPVGRLFFQIRGAFAEYERELIRERTRAGLDAARRRGKTLGRPSALTQEKRQRLARLLAAGHSQRRIAEILECGKGTVGREVARLGLHTAA